MDDNMKLFLNKVNLGKKINKTFDKIKNLENELFKIKYAKNPNKLQSELRVK